MITKENVLEYILKNIAFVASGGIAIQALASYNPIHAVFGAAGQFVWIVGSYVRSRSNGKEIKKQPIMYWLGCIFLGAVLGYIFTTWTSEKIGFDEVISGILLGMAAQFTADIFDSIMEFFKNKINKHE